MSQKENWIFDRGLFSNKKVLAALLFCVAFVPTFIQVVLKMVILRGPKFAITHLLFNYEIEFVKRGLIGELLRLVFSEITFKIAMAFFFIILAVALAVLVLVFFKPYKLYKKPGLFLFFLLAITHFATANQFIYDIGRFDQFLLIITFVCMIMICRLKTLSYFLLPLLIVLGLLIHEAFLFMFIPLIFAYYIYKRRMVKRELAFLFLLGGLAICSTYIIGTRGMVTTMGYEEYYSNLKEGEKALVSEGASNIPFRGLKDNLEYSFARNRDKNFFLDHMIFLIALSPTIFLFGKIFKALVRNRKELLLAFSALTPLLLYLLGHDFARWWGLAITNAFIVISLLALKKSSSEKLEKACIENKHLIINAIIISLVLGPIGIYSFFPRIVEGIKFLVMFVL
jgi:hypothetical protein